MTSIFLGFMPILITLLLSLSFFEGHAIQKKELLHLCRSEGLQIQKRIAASLNHLMALNEPAEKLIQKKITLTQKLDIALSTGQEELAAAIRVQIELIKIKQSELHLKQEKFITYGDLDLKKSSEEFLLTLQQKINRRNSSWNHFIKIELTELKKETSKLPVRPQYPEIAPIYDVKEPLSETSKLAYFWKEKWRIPTSTIHWSKMNWEKEELCITGLKYDGKFSETILVKP